jgi:basic amino acid/polyamine antiporter, APA family
MAKSQVFLRDATGLVRSFTWYDAMILSLAVTGPTLFGISSQIGYVAPNGPGADFVVSAIIGFLFMIPLGVVYYLFSVQMPRSGGDYIWLGRTLNPVLGFVGGWAMFISFIALLASASVTEPAVVIPDVSVALGYIWNNPGLISWGQNLASSNTNLFAGTLLTIVIGVVIASLTPRVYSKIMVILAGIIFLASFIFIGAFAAASSSSFASGLSSMTNGAVTVNGVVSQANQANMPFVAVNNTATFLAIPFGVLLFNGFNYSVYISGEVRNVKYGMLWGVLIALLICGALDVTGLFFVVRAEGYPFVQAAFGLFGAGNFPLGVSPWSPLFVPAVLGNPYLSSLVEIGFLLFNFWWAAGLAMCISRYVFAFSFDRVLPTVFADVNDRLHVPLKAIGFTLVIAIILSYIAIFTTYIGQLLNVVTIWTIVWMLVGISAIVLPFWKKQFTSNLPGGKWLLPFFGLLTIIGMGTTFYWSVSVPAIGPSTLGSDALLLVIFGSAVVIYAARYLYFKGRGLNLIQGQMEIPPE